MGSGMVTVKGMEPRQLGTLHGRMAYLLSLMGADRSFAGQRNNIHHAAWDLLTIVERIPDLAFEDDGFGPVVPLDKASNPKLGIEKTPSDLLFESKH